MVKKEEEQAAKNATVAPETTEPISTQEAAAVTAEAPRTPEIEQEPNLERQESPISIRAPGGNTGALNPDLERHVSHIGSSSGDSASLLSAAEVVGTGESTDIAAAVMAENPAVHLATDEPTPVREASKVVISGRPGRESKGRFSGIFGKIKNRRSKSVTQREDTGVPKASTDSAASDTVQPAKQVSHGKALAGATGVENAGGASPSSFRRHEDDLHSISSLSSDEGQTTGRKVGRTSTADSDDAEFEEARDTFDETLAPPRGFSLSKQKSASPVRETKFQEEL